MKENNEIKECPYCGIPVSILAADAKNWLIAHLEWSDWCRAQKYKKKK